MKSVPFSIPLISLLLAVVGSQRVRSQTVFIPDTQLRTVLNEWVPGCVDASGYLDPEVPDALVDTSLAVEVTWTPADLTGLSSLTGLRELIIRSECDFFPDQWSPCDANTISSPEWPMGLTALSILRGTWTAFPTWPSDLRTLVIQAPMGLSQLPALPTGLTALNIMGSDDLSIAPGLPAALTSLSMTYFNDTELPLLPAGLSDLMIGRFDAVTFFSTLPPALEQLNIGACATLAELPVLPNGLLSLSVASMPQIVQVPALPTTLNSLLLGDLGIAEIPALPEGLYMLDIIYLPQLHCLPQLPDGLSILYVDIDPLALQSTPLACLPNIPAGLDITVGSSSSLDPSTLCTVLNSTCDVANPVATGSVYWDQNANGIHEGGEPGYPLASVTAQPNSITTGVSANGDFMLPLPLAQYTLAASSSNPYVLSISPNTHEAPFTTSTDVDAGNDFGVTLQPNIQDLRIDQSWPWGRPGYESTGWISYENIGTLAMNGTVTLELDAYLSWVGATPVPSNVSGNTITWDFAALNIAESRMIQYTVYTDPGVALGTLVENVVTIGPVESDETGADNVDIATGEVIGSYDPNDKRVEPASLTPAQVAAGEELEYTIRFQNTGTYQADRVIITDTLSSDLQWSTMRMIASSHPCSWMLLGSGVLRFTFDPIFLPDSTSDEPNSHGFVKFAMRPSTSLMLGEVVGNIANIYFDYNEPVITNEAVFAVEENTSISEHAQGGLRLWPNPAGDVLWMECAGSTAVEVLGVDGRVVHRQRVSGGRPVDVRDLSPGTYSVRTADGRAMRFVKR